MPFRRSRRGGVAIDEDQECTTSWREHLQQSGRRRRRNWRDDVSLKRGDVAYVRSKMPSIFKQPYAGAATASSHLKRNAKKGERRGYEVSEAWPRERSSHRLRRSRDEEP